MKELSIEEKAKAYDEAKLRMSAAYNSNRCTIGFMNEIFPELKESEGERIKREISEALQYSVEKGSAIYPSAKTTIEEALAWLEKQGEQKPDSWLQELEDKLANATPKQLAEWKEKYFKEEPAEWSEEDDRILYNVIAYVGFAAGQKGVRDDALKETNSWLNSLKDRVQLQPKLKKEWSKEEEKMLDEMYEFFDKHKIPSLKHDMNDYVKFIKSLKDRVQPQPKREWNEEDEKRLDNTITQLKAASNIIVNDEVDDSIAFIKSLKDRVQPKPTWRPSDRQMNVLEHYMHTLSCNEHKEILFGLYQDLNKLKESYEKI